MARFLVVDDEKEMRHVIRKMLEHAGHNVQEAADGREALAMYRADPADIVICDLIMPGKEGIETISEIMAEYPDARIIAISGGGKIADPDRYLDLAHKIGASKLLPKPFKINDLLQAVNDLLSA